MTTRRLGLIVVVCLLAFAFLKWTERESTARKLSKVEAPTFDHEEEVSPTSQAESSSSSSSASEETPAALPAAPIEKSEPASADDASSVAVRDYRVEDGVAVIEGDIVIGLPGSSGRAAQIPAITPWPTHEIPVYVQPSLPNPGRVLEALTYFEGSGVSFVPVTNQRDVIVFENGTGRCKSYMGKIGGKQPIFLAPNCGPHEIAHELMHALGFIHEQNRTDRDQAIRVNRDNIEGTALLNFEKFPTPYMTLSGLAPFDFTSLMLYPPSMFSRNGEPTISPVGADSILPSQRLSVSDAARINLFYGSR